MRLEAIPLRISGLTLVQAPHQRARPSLSLAAYAKDGEIENNNATSCF
jgi:hypothetical protein